MNHELEVLSTKAFEYAKESHQVHYIVKGADKALGITTIKPHCLEWRKRKFEWVRTILPYSKEEGET